MEVKSYVGYLSSEIADRIQTGKIEDWEDIVIAVGLLRSIPYLLKDISNDEFVEILYKALNGNEEPGEAALADEVNDMMTEIIKKARENDK